jgi:hypothetical protein
MNNKTTEKCFDKWFSQFEKEKNTERVLIKALFVPLLIQTLFCIHSNFVN